MARKRHGPSLPNSVRPSQKARMEFFGSFVGGAALRDIPPTEQLFPHKRHQEQYRSARILKGTRLLQLLDRLKLLIQNSAEKDREGPPILSECKGKADRKIRACKERLWVGLNEVSKSLERMNVDTRHVCTSVKQAELVKVDAEISEVEKPEVHVDGMKMKVEPPPGTAFAELVLLEQVTMETPSEGELLAEVTGGAERNHGTEACVSESTIKPDDDVMGKQPLSSSITQEAVGEMGAVGGAAMEDEKCKKLGEKVLLVIHAMDVHPRLLISHLMGLAALRNVPVIAVSGEDGSGSVKLGAALGLRTATAVGFKEGGREWDSAVQSLLSFIEGGDPKL